ncbi:hypothetical protein ACDF64_10195 [Agromyces sp. MMS24-JH15]|uniref:hypothetical protein n=1 Tax=Agromyces sp. MMS24-JH15 TaxID=3243765 RepID=UPI0037499CAA
MDDNETGIPRRAVLAAAAWTVPVVAVAVASPAAAASLPITLIISYFDLQAYSGSPSPTDRLVRFGFYTSGPNGAALEPVTALITVPAQPTAPALVRAPIPAQGDWQPTSVPASTSNGLDSYSLLLAAPPPVPGGVDFFYVYDVPSLPSGTLFTLRLTSPNANTATATFTAP